MTQVLARLRSNDPRVVEILEGREVMIESPMLQQLNEEWTREEAQKATRIAARKATQRTVTEDLAVILDARSGSSTGVIKED